MQIALWVAAAGVLALGCSKTETPQPAAPVTSSAVDAAKTSGLPSDDAGAAAARAPKKLEDAIWEPDVSRYIIGQVNKPLALVEVRKPDKVTLKIEAEGKSATDLQKAWTELHPEKGIEESVHAPRKGNERGPLESRNFGPGSSAWKLLLKEKLEARQFSLDTVPRWADAAPPASMSELVMKENDEELAVVAFANNAAALKRTAAGGGGSFFKSFFESATKEPPLVVFYARPNGASGPDTLVVAKAKPGEASYPATVRAYFVTHINRYDRYVYTVVP